MNSSDQPPRQNPALENAVSRSARGPGWVTRAMCQERARELAALANRPLRQVWQADYLQAKRELTGETDPDLQDAILDAAPETDFEKSTRHEAHRSLTGSPRADAPSK